MIQQHPVLEKKLNSKKAIKWDLEFVFLKELLDKIYNEDMFVEYQKNSKPTWDEDLKWFEKCFKNHIATSDFLYDYLEDQNITWIDDLPLVNTFLFKILKQARSDQRLGQLPFPEFIKSEKISIWERALRKVHF